MRRKIDYELVLAGYEKYCLSSYGKEYLRSLNPGTVELESEYGCISEMITYIRESGIPDSDAFTEVRPLLGKVENGLVLDGTELLEFLKFFEGVGNLKKTFKFQRGPLFSQNLLATLTSRLGNYEELVKAIRHVVDEQGNVKDDASVLLKKIRTEYAETVKQLRHKVERFVSNYQNLMQELTYTIKNERYVLPIKANERGKVKGIVHGTSASGLTVYVEPEELIPLNDRLKVLLEEESREVTRILRELSSHIFQSAGHIKRDIEVLKRLDAIIARARYALEHNAALIIPSGRYLKLVKARHPLLAPDKVVPIDLELPTDKLGMVITGPNTGGKTVSLKTIALCILLAKSGFPVLVSESSRIPDLKVFVDIGDPQDILENLSTFSGHVVNIKNALEMADEDSIVLIDELGSGTDPYEGSAIALGIIEELIERRIKFIVTTHLTPIKLYAMSHDKIVTASMEFDPESLAPTYRILMNVPGASHAFEIAAKYGLPENVLQRARKHLNEDHIRIEELIKNLNVHVSELEAKKRELEATLREYNKQKRELEEKYKLLKVKRVEEFDKEIRNVYKEIQEAKRNLQIALQSTRTSSESLIKKRLKEIEREEEKVQALQDKIEKVMYETAFQKEERSIEVGDFVRLVDGTAVGKVVEKKGEKFVVDFNGIRIEVKPEKIVKVQTKPESTVEVPEQGRDSRTSMPRIPLKTNEIDVRGLTVEEAVEKIDEFIDQLVLSDFSVGYIIHGKGTGRLATGIWNYLRNDKRVKSYRFGRPDEGGVGVTVVEV
ncbi:DNA mismatch repair protein MutS [Fervidobacterium thailandense]|uniref:Endonuclease MutS2 n=1 Tax=Fervidobacterium thailandense TaxID=1008305 RepID=A0A1E3G4K0_9BACT|nr:DNA mismatch repair protein MutS [Fervidobacterium thailandense]